MDQELDIDRIVKKYIRDEALSAEEQAFLNDWVSLDKNRVELLRRMKDDFSWTKQSLKQLQDMPYNRIWDKVETRLQAEGFWLDEPDSDLSPVVTFSRAAASRRPWRWIAAASLILIAAGATIWGLRDRFRQSSTDLVAPTASASEVLPGGNRATLTLNDGRQINLDSTGNGVLASQGNTFVAKVGDGKLAYNNASSSQGPVVATYNRLTTPRAGQFQLTLPDGTHVWLNNASSLRYPVFFTGATREVELSGEAYFEVARDATHPFKVHVVDGPSGAIRGDIEVLGTSFNIMAYNDESAERATLIDGSIRCVHAGNSVVLHPDEQSVLNGRGELRTLRNVNIAEITAWKNGYFHFDHTDLPTTMRQLSRWYDISVVYEGTISPQEFHGRIQRSLPLTSVLKGLEGDHVRFHLDGKKLTVTP
jgi:transmembrane sensor